MKIGRAVGSVLFDCQIKSMMEGKKTLVKGLKGKKGSYDVYFISGGLRIIPMAKTVRKSKDYSISLRLAQD
jgi:DNA topoisomerase-3